jgi:type II secretory pathway pseudopilin PulG
MRTGDEGTSLVEVLLATAILGIAVVVLISGLTTAVFSSGQHRQQASAGAYLRSAVEAVKGQNFVPCAGTGSYTVSGVVTAGSGFDQPVITSVTHFTAAGGSLVALPVCTTATNEVQVITMSVSSSDARTAESVRFSMRRP